MRGKPQSAEGFTTKERAEKYDSLKPLLDAMFREFQEFTKKKPEAAVSKSKVKIVNRLLSDLLAILQEEPSRPYLDSLDEDDLPQNSDVLLILGQFDAAMDTFRERYYRRVDNLSYDMEWKVK